MINSAQLKNDHCSCQASLPISEKDVIVQDDSGYRLQLHEIDLDQLGLKWGSYRSPKEKVLSFCPGKAPIISHFRLSDDAVAAHKRSNKLSGRKFIVYRNPLTSYELQVSPTRNRESSFLELMMSERFFDRLLTEESDFLMNFYQTSASDAVSFDFTAGMTPGMYRIIGEMRNPPYMGALKAIYLEAKATELFLMQVTQLDQKTTASRSKLKSRDIETLHAIRDHLAANYQQHCSINDLARLAGINQMKLKNGFKELFGATVFGFVNDVRMQEAKRLLSDEKMYVAEVAEMMGYSHPHHFTVAFKKKFGLVPMELKQ